ncbi:putative methyltransferase-domain-containing protein [Hyaloraphidium curvatum]|nr:putative methyltransferase-domain-containing protein [Hyaloraphidium curvatum]
MTRRSPLFSLLLVAVFCVLAMAQAGHPGARAGSENAVQSAKAPLLLPPASYFHRLDFHAGASTKYRFTIAGRPIFLFPDPDLAEHVSPDNAGLAPEDHAARTGTSLWDCAVVLAKFLEHATHHPDPAYRARFSVEGKRVVELGSGLGLLGIAAFHLPTAHVTLTDLPPLVSLLPPILALNSIPPSSPRVALEPLDWTSFPTTHPLLLPDRMPDVLLAADVVWLPHLVAPLLDVVDRLLGREGRMLMGYQERSARTTDLFLRGLEERGLTRELVRWEGMEAGGEWERPGIEIWEIRRGETGPD